MVLPHSGTNTVFMGWESLTGSLLPNRMSMLLSSLLLTSGRWKVAVFPFFHSASHTVILSVLILVLEMMQKVNPHTSQLLKILLTTVMITENTLFNLKTNSSLDQINL